jgi:hypothetical protein
MPPPPGVNPVAAGYAEKPPKRKKKKGIVALGNRPGTLAVGGFTPDYQALLQNDPLYAQMRDFMLPAQRAAADAQRDAALQRALIDFGEMPDLSSVIPGWNPAEYGITPETQALIEQANRGGVSALARARLAYMNQQRDLGQARSQTDRSYQTNLANIMDALAARGILRSGATGVARGEAERSYNDVLRELGEQEQGLENQYVTSQYDARRQVLDFIANLQSSFAQGEQERQNALAQAAQDAYNRQMGLPQNQPVAPTEAKYDPKTGYWVGPGGLYNAQGQAVNTGAAHQRYADQIRKMRQRGMSWAEIKKTTVWNRFQATKP